MPAYDSQYTGQQMDTAISRYLSFDTDTFVTTTGLNTTLEDYLTVSSASSTYLTQSDASSTYLTQTNAANTYLTQSTASTTYLTQTGAANTYLPLTGGTISGNLTYKNNAIDASKADNNVSSTQWPTVFNITDTAGRIITRQEAVVTTDGKIAGYWYVRNYDTSGTQVAQKGIQMTMDTAGTLTWTVSDAANFRTAISSAGLKMANSYWGITSPSGEDNVWIRTTSQGFIPYQSGSVGGGHNYLGTSSWFFAYSYIDQMHAHQLVLEGATNATMTAASTNPRISFQEGTGSQPVHLIYTDYDSYRAPAGLKVIGGDSATPAWFEVEGAVYGKSWNATSSREIKHEITNLSNMGTILDKLNPVSYIYNDDPFNQKRYGLIYEDTVKICPVICSEHGASKTINYIDLIPVLIKEIQSLRIRVKQLENK